MRTTGPCACKGRPGPSAALGGSHGTCTDRDVELTVLMPCLDEAETVATCVAKALAFLMNQDVDGEVVVADKCSTDGSSRLAEAARTRMVSIPERGYGSVLLGGSGRPAAST